MGRLFMKLTSLALALCLFAAMPAAAEGTISDDLGFTYESTGGTLRVTGYSGTATDVVIPAEVNGVKVTGIADYAFYDKDDIVSVVIPDGVTDIAQGAFYDCAALASVVIPEGVVSIGDGAFGRCPVLAGVVLPESLKRIGTHVFYRCDSLAAMTVPVGVEEIGDYAFAGNAALSFIEVAADNAYYTQEAGVLFSKDRTEILAFPMGMKTESYVIPEGVLTIRPAAFFGAGFSSVTIPEGVTVIGDSAFNYCSALTEINLPQSLTDIGTFAFNSCTGLTEVLIPAGVKTIGESAFEVCTNLTAINVDQENPVYVSDNGVLFDNVQKMLHTYPGGKTEQSYQVPEGTLLVGPSAFYTSRLVSVTISDGVTDIGSYAFGSCKELTSVEIPGSVQALGEAAFYLSTALEQVVLPEGVARLGDYAFNSCSNLSAVTLPESLTSIGQEAFGNTAALTVSGLTGSYAEDYAAENGFTFTSLGQATGEVSGEVQGVDAASYFAAEPVMDIYGNAYDASMMLERPTLVNVWATWCGPCVSEIPALMQLASEYAGRVNFIGLQLDALSDERSLAVDEGALAAARTLFEKSGNTYPSLIPTQQIMTLVNSMNVSGIPTTWFLDAGGRLVDEKVGSNNLEGWRAAIEKFLAGQAE